MRTPRGRQLRSADPRARAHADERGYRCEIRESGSSCVRPDDQLMRLSGSGRVTVYGALGHGTAVETPAASTWAR
jgi:hypothetical protein